MTKVQHRITRITKCDSDDDCIAVLFREIPPPEMVESYMKSAQVEWSKSGHTGLIPKEMQTKIKYDRLTHALCEMHFPYLEWQKRNLMLNQKVEINLPLSLDDVILLKEELDT